MLMLIIIILTILVMMTLMMIVALEVAVSRVVAAINNVCWVTGQTNGFPLIRSNMGEPGVWGCFRSFAFHSHFLQNMGERGVWGCFRSFAFHSHFLLRSTATADSWQNNKAYLMLLEFSQVLI